MITPEALLACLLDDVGEGTYDLDDWALDAPAVASWFTANHPDGRMVEAYISSIEDGIVTTHGVTLYH